LKAAMRCRDKKFFLKAVLSTLFLPIHFNITVK